MEVLPSKKLPHFSEYVAAEAAELKRSRRTAWTFPIAGVSGILGLAVAGLLTQFVMGPIAIPLVIGGWVGGIVALNKSMSRPRTSEERLNAETEAILKRYVHSMHYKRLHRDLDNTAAQLLEASAYYWSKIRLTLNSASWNSELTPLHLRAVRTQTLQAIQEAMREQITLCVRCLALPGQRKNADFRDIIEDALGIDVDKVLDSIRSMPSLKKGNQSERLPEIFDPARAIAEKLKNLSVQIDQMTLETVQRAQGQGIGASGTLDAALRSLQEIKVAEAELDNEQRA